MKTLLFPMVAALLMVSACSTANNGMAAREMASPETPSGGVVPGQQRQ
ncbi:hypothetical protein [Fulvimarina sp. MAC8]